VEKQYDYWNTPEKSVVKFIEEYDKDDRKKVLDLGCGIGRHSLLFAKAFYKVTALDSSLEALEELKKRAEKEKVDIKVVQGCYLNRSFKNKSFDVILSYNVIYHGSRKDIQKAINICRNYLSENGIFFFTCPTRDDGKYGVGKKVGAHTYESADSTKDVHYFSDEKDIYQYIDGFKLVSINRNEHYWINNGVKQFSSYWEVIVKK